MQYDSNSRSNSSHVSTHTPQGNSKRNVLFKTAVGSNSKIIWGLKITALGNCLPNQPANVLAKATVEG